MHPLLGVLRIGTIRKNVVVEDNVSNVVNTARLPLFDLVLIVVVVVAQVNAGNSAGVVLGTLLLVDDGIDQAEDGPLQEALVL
jgi:hypothetical protein